MLVQPLGEAAELLDLALVHLPVAFGVVADEHLGEVRVVLLDLLAELVAVLEVELVLARLLDRHRELVAARLRLARDRSGRTAPSTRTPADAFGAPSSTARWNPSQISVFAPGTRSTSPTIFSNDPRWSNARM